MFFIARTLNGTIRKLGEHSVTNISKPHYLTFNPALNNIILSCNTSRQYSTPTAESESEINYEEIANGDKEMEYKLKILALETEVMRQDGKAVPDNSFLRPDHWRELVTKTSRSARQKYLEYLFKIEKKNENKKAKSDERKKHYQEYLARREWEKSHKTEETLEEFASKHDLQHNNIFLRFYDTTINQMYNNRLIQAMQFGQKLVVDVGYDSDMTKRENINCAKQLMLLFAENRAHDDPFDIHFCNANNDGDVMKQLRKFIPTADEPWFPLNLHECSYLDMFPKEQLVYLTPHVREEIKEFDHDAVYIIGGIVDKINQDPLSLAKAKREGLKMAKLPLDRHLSWGAGSGKSLTLNQVAAILLDQKVSGNWEYSLRHVPRRKLFSEESTLRSIDRVYNRRRFDTDKARSNPHFGKVNFDKLSYNNNSPKSRSNENRQRSSVNVKNIFND